MPILADRKASQEVFSKAAQNNMSIAIFCTGSYWNTEAILLAASRIADKYGLETVPVVVATTFTYRHMPQSQRFMYCGDAKAGFLSHIAHLHALTEGKYAPYRNVKVLPHIDHADPNRDRWALTTAVPYLSSVMFDAQSLPYEQNLELTTEYVRQYGDQVLVEGIIEMLNVEGGAVATHIDHYCEKAVEYIGQTGVDFIVADLGTEQQTSEVGNASYNRERARQLTQALQKKMLVLHGTSCLKNEQICSLADDGVIRVNMWTRIAREAGQYASEKLLLHIDDIRSGRFEYAESLAYIRDNVEKAADIMEEMMEKFGYANWHN